MHTHELYLDAQNNLYGEHLWYEGDRTRKWGHRVWRRSPNGRISDVIPATEGFRTDYSFVRDAAGNMYWASGHGCPKDADARRVQVCKRTADGRSAPLTRRDAGLKDIRWMAASPDGHVYLIDSGSLKRVAPDGKVTTMASGLDQTALTVFGVLEILGLGRQHRLMGLWADVDGSVYVANPGARQVWRVGADGVASVFCRSSGPYSATGVTVAGNYVYVLEYALPATRVRRFRKDGSESKW